MNCPGINGKAAWRLYIECATRQSRWRERMGYVPRIVREDQGFLTCEYIAEPPEHWFYGRVISFMYSLGFIPF